MKLPLIPLLVAAFLQSAPHPAPVPARFQYARPVSIPPGEPSAACAPLDAAIYTHAAPALTDLRLFTGTQPAVEVPYALTLSDTPPTADPARILNRGVRGRHIVFDLAMPPRPYTHVILDLAAQDFVATARVTGLRTPSETSGTYLGTFTLFDLASQSLARNTTLPLSESTFPYLHIDLDVISDGSETLPGPPTPLDAELVHAATVPPSREAETIYTTVATSTSITQHDRESITTFTIPAHLPVERVAFTLAPNPPNFSRTVSIRARAQGTADAQAEILPETLSDQISHIKLTQHGQRLDLDSLAIPATVASNAQTAATLEVAVDNGDDQPLPITAVSLQMRQRRLCFNIPQAPVLLYYGDPTLRAPLYDLSRTFDTAAPTRRATLGPESPNPLYQPTTARRPFTERHPALLWLALLAIIALLGVTALRTAKHLP